MAGRRKYNEDENLDDTHIERVIKFLEEKGTKKDACKILNISYNTSRLDKLIETYKTKKEEDRRRRSEKRGKPATQDEISYVITEYLEGKPLDGIANALYRGTALVKRILEDYSVPQRNNEYNYFKPALIPDGAVKDKFVVGEKVYSARYDCLAEIRAELIQNGNNIYRIWLLSDDQSKFAYQPSWELASLDTLRNVGISI